MEKNRRIIATVQLSDKAADAIDFGWQIKVM